MSRKDRLRIKLLMYTLIESRLFILNHYDTDLSENLSILESDGYRHGMLRFTLVSISFFNEPIPELIDTLLKELLKETDYPFSTAELLYFAKHRIPVYIDRLRDNLILIE